MYIILTIHISLRTQSKNTYNIARHEQEQRDESEKHRRTDRAKERREREGDGTGRHKTQE